MASATIEQEQASRFRQVPILGLPVHMVQIPDVVAVMTHWVTHERVRPHWVVVADMHAVVEAYNRADFRRMVRQADLTVPDGISLVKVAQWKGGAVRSRVAGTDLMKAFFSGTQGLGFRHYFYGDTDLTLERLTGNLTRQYSGLTVAGAYSPPFRPLTEEEDEAAIRRINEAKPDVLWVGLGLPKQEQWIYTHRDRLDVPLVLGVGAAFKFLAGTVQRAPDWVGDMGFEWLWRFGCEPRRLWKRVMIEGTQFVGLVALELAGWRDFS